MKRLKDQAGFTIVELILAISIAMILTTVLLTISMTYFGNVMQNNRIAELSIENHYALRAIVEDIRLADSIQASSVLTDANAPSTGWNTDDAANMLVIGSPATTSSYDIVYDDSTGYPYSNELVYYISGTSLHKRTIRNAAATGNSATTSCPPASATSGCPADRTYTTHIADLSFNFFDELGAATTDPALARSVEVTLTTQSQSYGKTLSYTNTMQTTLRNR